VSRTRRAQRGQSLLEFAIVVPLFLLLLFALIDFSRLLFTYVSLVNGARDLSRMAAISSRTTQAAGDGIAAFDTLTKIGGATNPATVVTLSPAGGGSASCSSLTTLGCTFKLSPSGGTSLTLSPGAHASGSGTLSISAPTALGVTGNGDFVVMTWLDGAGSSGVVQICPLAATPLVQTSCTPAANYGSFAHGFVQVDLNYTFRFNPLFQNRLASVVDVSFMRQSSQLTTSARTYME
jgi:Flp pilus assembly protein TadG